MIDTGKICFIEPPYGWFAEKLDPPFPLMYLAAVAEKAGWEAQIVEMENSNSPIPDADIHAVTSTSPQWPDTVALSERLDILFPDSLKIVGGNHISAETDDFDQTKFDVAVLGEGEEALERILRVPEAFKQTRTVMAGISPENLDDVPFPARHLIDWPKYKRGIFWGKKLLEPAVGIIMSRGCPHNCIFCGSHQIFGHKARFRSVENVVAEMKTVIGEMGYHGFNWHDDTFCLQQDRVFKLCKEFKKLDVVWRCLSRVNTVNEKILAAMRGAGCKEIIYGIESYSQKILNILRKGSTVEQNLKAMKLTKKAGIQAKAGIIVGSPGETWDTVKETEKGLRECPPDYWNISVFTPFPGCYDADTEILTHDGWKPFPELKTEDKIASLDEDGFLIYEKPLRFYDYIYEGRMWRVKSRQVDLLVTPDHNMWCKRPNGRRSKSARKICGGKQKLYTYPFRFYKADDILRHPNVVFQKNAKWQGKEVDWFELPPTPFGKGIWNKGPTRFRMDDFLEFLGYYVSEGSTDVWQNQYRICISQAKHSPHRRKMTDCLKRMGFHVYEGKTGLCFSNKSLSCYLKPLGHAPEKFIPQRFMELSSRQLNILFSALVCGDGTVHKGNRNYFTVSKKLVDQIQELLVKVGSSGNVKSRPPRKCIIRNREIHSYRPQYYIGDHTSQCCPRLNRKGDEFYQESYSGKVYCVETPHHILYVRRNGKPVWCGNSFAWAHPEKLGLKILTRDLRQYAMVGRNYRGNVCVATEEMSKEDIEHARDELIDLCLEISPQGEA